MFFRARLRRVRPPLLPRVPQSRRGVTEHVPLATRPFLHRRDYAQWRLRLRARLAPVSDDVSTLAGRTEVPATKFELLTAVALKLLRDTRVAWPGLGKCVDDARKHSPRVHVWSTSLYSRWLGRQQLPRYEFPQLVTKHLLRRPLTSRYVWSLRPRTAYEGAECPLRERCSLC
jgi:hypothetical protein